MSGQWWENDLIVGPFTDLAAANAWAAANPSSLFPGLLATAGGVQIRWGGGGWIAGKRAGNTVACFGNSIGAAWMPVQNGATVSWAAGISISLGAVPGRRYFDLRSDSLTKFFTCTKAGVTGGIEPVWETCPIGGVIVDGTAEYTCTLGQTSNAFGFGYWTFSQMMAGQPLEEVFLMSYGGAKSPLILEYRSKAEACNPDIMYYGPMFENDCWPGKAPVLSVIEANWAAFESVVRDDISKGRTVIVQTLLPNGGMDATGAFIGYSYGDGSKARQWLNAKIRDLAIELDLILFDASSVYTDGNPANPVWPDNTETFVAKASTGQGLKLTDGIHPGVVAAWRIALQFSKVLSANFPALVLQSDAGDVNRRSPNPNHYGASGNLGLGASGQVSNSWTVNAYGAGGAAVCSKVARTLVNWWNRVVYSVTEEVASLSAQYALPLSPWAVGEWVRMLSEIRVEAGSTKLVKFDNWLKFTGGAYANVRSAVHPGQFAQDIGQAITEDITLVLKTPWVKVPTGTSAISTETRFDVRGPGGCTANFGRSFVERKTTNTIQ